MKDFAKKLRALITEIEEYRDLLQQEEDEYCRQLDEHDPDSGDPEPEDPGHEDTINSLEDALHHLSNAEESLS